MTKAEVNIIREKLESIKLNCEEQIAKNCGDQFAQSNWQHSVDALERLRNVGGWKNASSAENGKKGGRPRKA